MNFFNLWVKKLFPGNNKTKIFKQSKTKKMQFNFILNNVIHSIDIKKSATPKLAESSARILQTYTFSIEQVLNKSLVNDKEVCFNCPFSYNQNNGKTGGCYTHKGLLSFGLKSKLNRLNKLYLAGKIQKGYIGIFEKIYKYSLKYPIKFARFGTYGEPTLMPIEFMHLLSTIVKKYSGYTHQYMNVNREYSRYLMASTHNIFEVNIAKSEGYRSFLVGSEKPGNFVLCPSSSTIAKDNKISCANCGLCSGSNIGAKSIFEFKH